MVPYRDSRLLAEPLPTLQINYRRARESWDLLTPKPLQLHANASD